MKKILFQGDQDSLLVSRKDDEILIEMSSIGFPIYDLQLGDNYSWINFTKDEAIDFAHEILKMVNYEKE
jgi:hypothetical protein